MAGNRALVPGFDFTQHVLDIVGDRGLASTEVDDLDSVQRHGVGELGSRYHGVGQVRRIASVLKVHALLGAVAKGLPHFWCVDPRQANPEERTAWGKYLNRVAVAYADAAPVDDVLGK